MLKLKTIKLKNFLSIGNIEQEVILDKDPLTLVLGENLDTPNNSGARNGVGKSTIIQAICYAIYGSALTQIKKDNLINKTNGKNMSVVLEFEKNGEQHRLERGRRPHYLRWVVNNKMVNSPDTDEAEGDSRWTQKEIERVFGISLTLFKHIVVMNTFTEPFLAMPISAQRQVIEELLGITQLSLKAEKLKEKIKSTKDKIREEEIRIQATRESNNKIQKSISDLERKSSLWERECAKKISSLEEALKELEHLDVQEEIENHKIIAQFLEIEREISNLERNKASHARALNNALKQISIAEKEFVLLKENKCPSCEQKIQDHKHEVMVSKLEERLSNLNKEVAEYESELTAVSDVLDPLVTEFSELGEKPTTFYDNIEEAYNHRSTVESLTKELMDVRFRPNAYVDQIETLKKESLQEIVYDTINSLTRLKDHQEYLLRFLTNKDSFIRKRIIDQNLNYLNHRLSVYLNQLQLPHQVVFLNDLSVEISELGLEFDFDNLSRGERTRLILSLSWAFRDVYESMNMPVNMLFIDELIDNGLDPAGVESSLEVLKKMSREHARNIFLISHREELINRVTQILMVVKENGFTMLQSM
jgi:DNA repair exonuclease SbcCD ATPase subunit